MTIRQVVYLANIIISFALKFCTLSKSVSELSEHLHPFDPVNMWKMTLEQHRDNMPKLKQLASKQRK